MQCQQEKGIRKYLNVNVEQVDVDDWDLIRNKLACAEQAINPLNISKNATEDQSKKFVMYALEYKAQAMWLNSDWWKRMIKKYRLPEDKNVYIDSTKSDFYYLEEK